MDVVTKVFSRTLRKMHPTTFLKTHGMDPVVWSGVLHIAYRHQSTQPTPDKSLQPIIDNISLSQLSKLYNSYCDNILIKNTGVATLNPVELSLLTAFRKQYDPGMSLNKGSFWSSSYFTVFALHPASDWHKLILKKHDSISIGTQSMDVLSMLAYYQREYISKCCDILELIRPDWQMTDEICNWNNETHKPINSKASYAYDTPLSGGCSSRIITMFCDHDSKELIVAFRGTLPNGVEDLSADNGIISGSVYTYARFQMAAQMIQNILKKYPGYTISTCGHSLGGTLAVFAFLFIPDDRRGSCIGFNAGNGVRDPISLAQDLLINKDQDLDHYNVTGNFCFDLALECNSTTQEHCELDIYKSCICTNITCPSPEELNKRFADAYIVRHASDMISLGWKEHTKINVIEVGRTEYTPSYTAGSLVNLRYHNMPCFVHPYRVSIIESLLTLNVNTDVKKQAMFMKVVSRNCIPPVTKKSFSLKSAISAVGIIPKTLKLTCKAATGVAFIVGFTLAKIVESVFPSGMLKHGQQSSSVIPQQGDVVNMSKMVCKLVTINNNEIQAESRSMSMDHAHTPIAPRRKRRVTRSHIAVRVAPLVSARA